MRRTSLRERKSRAEEIGGLEFLGLAPSPPPDFGWRQAHPAPSPCARPASGSGSPAWRCRRDSRLQPPASSPEAASLKLGWTLWTEIHGDLSLTQGEGVPNHHSETTSCLRLAQKELKYHAGVQVCFCLRVPVFLFLKGSQEEYHHWGSRKRRKKKRRLRETGADVGAKKSSKATEIQVWGLCEGSPPSLPHRGPAHICIGISCALDSFPQQLSPATPPMVGFVSGISSPAKMKDVPSQRPTPTPRDSADGP